MKDSSGKAVNAVDTLRGFAAGMQTGLIGYIVILNIEGNVVVPMIQYKPVNLAPALLISVQVLFSLIFGVLG